MALEYVRPTKKLEGSIAAMAELQALPMGDPRIQELSHSLININLVFEHLKAMLDTAVAMRLQFDDLAQKDKDYFTLKDQQTLTDITKMIDTFIVDGKKFLE
jgi:hypothetical protein